jgi:hypothetical protein
MKNNDQPVEDVVDEIDCLLSSLTFSSTEAEIDFNVVAVVDMEGTVSISSGCCFLASSICSVAVFPMSPNSAPRMKKQKSSTQLISGRHLHTKTGGLSWCVS